MTVYQDGLLLGIIANSPQNSRGQGKVLAIHDMVSKIRESSLDPDGLEMIVQPVGHLDNILTTGSIAAYAEDTLGII